MARVAGVDIPKNKRAVTALTYVFGIGHSSAAEIMTKAGICPEKKIKDMSEEELDKIRRVVDTEYQTEGNLRSEVRMNIKRLMDVGCYRGLRHRRGLPCHGQRTRTNSRTRKGPRKTIANKKKAPQK
ncbi:MAG: 30S ribosomal protein S13 [Chitinispirillales bacterium]|jgi:small subunit ribosomal protein S13|nr:30S ribosomal protein S13 [Chitinispirillales bacterium]